MIIFGDKTVALFDLWSLEHFFTGCNTALLATYFVKKYWPNQDKKITFTLQVLLLLSLELFWESLEYYLEDGISYDAVTYWFQGVEYIGNRLITDPIITVSGLFFIRKFPHVRWFSTIFSIAWLYIHIFVFDNCMALQNMLLDYLGVAQ